MLNEKAVKGKIKEHFGTKVILVDAFSTWFSNNCAISIEKDKESESRYIIRLFIYDPELERKFNFIEVSDHSNLAEAKNKLAEIKKKLNGNNPVLAIYSNVEAKSGNFQFKNILKVKLDKVGFFVKPLDILKINRGGYEHVAIYLGNEQVCHISGAEGSTGGLSNKINSPGAKIESWKKFLDRNSIEDITKYHPIIPFKRPEKIIENIKKVVLNGYGKGEYHLTEKNCEHFANKCVYGIDYSDQVEKMKTYIFQGKKIIDLEKEIRESNEFFDSLFSEKLIQEEMQRLNKILQETERLVYSSQSITRFFICEWIKPLSLKYRGRKRMIINAEELCL